MKIFLPKIVVFVLLLLFFTVGIRAQYTIIGNVNSSEYSCATFSGKTIIYIGNGEITNLSMNQTLDLYNSCSLGPIQFIVRNNASVDFSPGNERLVLPEGSSIIIEPGGGLIGGSCNASERIYIGTELIASCNGGAGADFAFNQLVANGGYNYVSTTVSPVCGSGTAAIAVSLVPTPTASTTYSLYTAASGGSAVSSVTSTTSPYNATLTTPTIASTTTYYVSATTGSITTPRREVVVTVNPIPTITGTLSVCVGSTIALAGSATADSVTPWFSATPSIATVNSSGLVTGVSVGTSVITYKNNNGCTISATVTVNAFPNNVINGFSATTICAGSTPQLTFNAEASSFSAPYSITYKNDATSIQYTIAIPSASAYSFTPGDNPTSNTGYTLVSISNASCTATTGFVDSGANLIVRPMPTATIGGTTSVCEGGSSPNITFTNPQTVAITITYAINGGANQTINIAASSSSNIAVATSAAGTFVYNLVSVVYQSTPNCSNALSGSATVTVNPNLPASVSISASPSGAICSGTSVTFTATPTNGGTTPSYQWKLNGGNVGSNSTTYINAALANGDVVTCVMTSNATPCLTGSPATSNTITMTVNPNLPASVSISASPSGAICSGTSVTFTAIPTNGGTTPSYQWELNGGNVGSNSTTYTNAALANGDVVTCVMTSNATPCSTGSPATSNSSTMTVNPLPIAPTIGTLIQPTCIVSTGSVVLNGLPASGTWTINPGGYTGTGTTTTISGLVVGTYNFTVSNGSCTSLVTANIAINPVVTNTWTTSWSNGAPSSLQAIVFNGNFSSTADLEVCSCQVTAGASVVINSGHTLKVTNSVDVQTNGFLTFENNASLVQINDAAVNSGNINYKRYTAPVKLYDFTYWSSPVVGQTLKNLSPNTLYDKYYSYDPNTGWVISYYGVAIMEAGKGYIIRAPQTFSTTVATIDTNPVFIGKPNNGVVSLALTANKFYLLGNPYPSAINADVFLDANSTVLEGMLYFWTHNTSPSTAIAGDATYNYTTNDYATYNRTGGVGTGTAAVTGGAVPTGKIAAGQGFFAPAKATGNIVFNNSMRIVGGTSGVDNSQFFKLSRTSNTSNSATVEKSRIWLNLTNKEGVFKQTLAGYITGATNDYDAGFDGVSYDGNQYVDFYSVNNAVNLSIQGRALPFEKKDSITLGYKSTIKGEFQISIDHTDGELTTQTVFLEDKVLKVLHDLTQSPYTFSTEAGRFNTRFVLRYVDKNAVDSVVDPPQVDETVLVSVNDNEIFVSSTEDLISKIIIYDILGKIIYQKEDVAANDFLIQYLLSSQQVLFVNVVLANGKTTSTKIIY